MRCAPPRKNDFFPINTTFWCIFTALHGMQTRSSDEISVCLSVRPSAKHVDCDKT